MVHRTNPKPTKITVAPLTQPASPSENHKAAQSLALNPHRPTLPPRHTPPRFPRLRLFGRLPPNTSSCPVPGRRPKTLNRKGVCSLGDKVLAGIAWSAVLAPAAQGYLALVARGGTDRRPARWKGRVDVLRPRRGGPRLFGIEGGV
jgi:hypothetical protein